MFIVVLLAILCIGLGVGAVPFGEIGSSFSDAIKEGSCRTNEEVVLFKKSAIDSVVTEQWFTGTRFLFVLLKFVTFLSASVNIAKDTSCLSLVFVSNREISDSAIMLYVPL